MASKLMQASAQEGMDRDEEKAGLTNTSVLKRRAAAMDPLAVVTNEGWS